MNDAPAYRIDERPVSAAAFYAAACDPQRSVVVEACAGAGKTWMLVSRILRALLAGVQPQQILAITFTRKAAGEMRERLDDWLAAFAETGCGDAERVQALRERGVAAADAAALVPQLARLHEQVLRGGRSVEVRSFHAWFAQLLAHAPLALLRRLGLPAVYEPIEDTAVLRPELLRRFHRSVQADASLRADYTALVGRHRRGTVLQWLDAAWQRGPELARADAAGHAEHAVPPAAQRWPECAGLADPAALLHGAALGRELQALARELAAGGKAQGVAAAAELAAALAAPTPAQAFQQVWRALFTDAGPPRKHLADTPLLRTVLAALERVHAMRLQQQAHDDHGAMLRLARVLLADYAQLKRERGLVDMADLERAAEALLGDGALAGWVQERLDQRLRQVLIDEFQDTSPLQWQALQGWLAAYAGAGGGASGQRPPAVFIVGDPKQSIYRFRGADPQVFSAATHFVVQGLQGQLLQCDHTRRNAPAVVAALNTVFADAATHDGWGPYRAHSTASGAAGAVRCLPGVARPPRAAAVAAAAVWRDSLTQPRDQPELHLRAAEGEQAAAAVAALIDQHGLQPGAIMVLARQRAALGFVAQALAQRGVPHVLAEPLALQESPEALDLTAVLDVLASPGHDLALARALKSPLISASDDDLLWLSQTRQPGRGWLATLLAAAAPPSPALARAQTLFAGWQASASGLPPHDLLDRIVHQGDFVARLAAAVPAGRRLAALHAVNALLAASLDQGGGRFASLYGFVRALRAGRVRATAAAPSQAVQLLTVHGAKGLEARAVIVVDADPEPRPRERATLLIDWPVDRSAPRSVAFVLSAAALAPSLQDAWAAEMAAAQREELNALYVAMTRAREWLVFSRTEPSRRGGAARAWWARVQPQAQAWTLSSAPAPATALADRAVDVSVLPALQWRPTALPHPLHPSHPLHPPPLHPPHPSRPPADDPASARLGQAVHRLLEWAGQPGAPMAVADRPAASAAAAAAAGLPAAAAARVLALGSQILDSPACAGFFGGTRLRWAGNEVPVASGGEPLRIDRLVALADDGAVTWWVLDYKLQSSPAALAANRAQLQRYVAAVQALQPADRVRGAFISGRGEVVEA